MKPNTIVIALSAALLALSFWNRNDQPGRIDGRPELAAEPRQVLSNRASIETTFNDIDYRIDPEYDYELYGLVVSFRQHDGSSRMHRMTSDHLNVADVCVIWGSNLANPDLDKFSFWNGIFTCNVQTDDQAAWEAFDIYGISNNHLISDDPAIRESLSDLRIGDQILIRGSLSSYTGPAGTRGTSTTRRDTGDGACETIYVDEFRVLESGWNPWRYSLYGSLATLLAALAIHFRRPFRPYRGCNRNHV